MDTLEVPDITLNAMPIGVFDSGLGGLTVARAIARALPNESIYYVGDTKRCPYGVRVVSSAEETTLELTDILRRRGQLALDGAVPEHRFATTSDNIAEFAAAGSFIFGQPLKSIEHISLEELDSLHERAQG